MPLLCRTRPAPSPSCLSERLESFEGGNTGRRTMRSCRLADGRPFSSRPGSSGSGGYRDFAVECKEGFAFKLHQKGVLRWTFTAVPWHQVPGVRQSQVPGARQSQGDLRRCRRRSLRGSTVPARPLLDSFRVSVSLRRVFAKETQWRPRLFSPARAARQLGWAWRLRTHFRAYIIVTGRFCRV